MLCSINSKFFQCYLKVVPSSPIAVIRGGTQRVARNDRNLIITGEDSINVDCAQGSEACFLYYTWRCSGIPFCNGFSSRKNRIVVPKEELQVGTFTVSLRVESPSGGEPTATNQLIKVVNQMIPTLQIR